MPRTSLEGVVMRVFLATAALVGGVLLCYAPWSNRVSAQAQGAVFNQANITSGERIRLWFDPQKMSYNCVVTEVRGDFIGCKSGDSSFSQGPERWYNLQLVAMIERPAR
jgi:hypothetical protein